MNQRETLLPTEFFLSEFWKVNYDQYNTWLLFLPGQSYEIRMLDNRKLGELPEINGKLVKVKKKKILYIDSLKYYFAPIKGMVISYLL